MKTFYSKKQNRQNIEKSIHSQYRVIREIKPTIEGTLKLACPTICKPRQAMGYKRNRIVQ